MDRTSLALVIGLAAAAGIAFAYSSHDSGSNAATPAPAITHDPGEQQDNEQDFGQLPPNHPAMGGGAQGAAPNDSVHGGMGAATGPAPNDSVHGGMGAAMGGGAMGGGPDLAPDDEPASVAWTAPQGWASAPNPNAMRLATYKVPAAPGEKDETELVVARAGGDLASNVNRWTGQFADGYALDQTRKTVGSLKVTRVRIEGTYNGGMGPQTGAHANWTMLAAIVEGKGEPYFFKVVGPTATVRAATKAFDAMIDGLTAK